MQGYTISEIAALVSNQHALADPDLLIEHLVPDSRKVLFPTSSLFIALSGPRRSGESYIADVYAKGCRAFLLSNKHLDISPYPDASFLFVDDVLTALQTIASRHRERYTIPVIGITGSNGKTIVKEWLFQILHHKLIIARSPKSYNSQTGVPLSVWQLNDQYDLAIFEAGISRPGEMANLEKIIKPTIGIFTGLGDAHDEGFASREEKVREKIKLFASCGIVIYGKDDHLVDIELKKLSRQSQLQLFDWSRTDANANLWIEAIKTQVGHTIITYVFNRQRYEIEIDFIDVASIENSITCLAALLHLKLSTSTIAERMRLLRPLDMRLQLKQGINDCSIINDSYSADTSSLTIALDFLEQQKQHKKHTVILSDILQSGKPPEVLYKEVALMLASKNVDRLIGIGPVISSFQNLFRLLPDCHFYSSTELFVEKFTSLQFDSENILLKGARIFEFENIVKLLEQKVHQTLLEIDLGAMLHNLKAYQELLDPQTKLMVMVKASGYGSGGYEIANLLQFHKVDYLAVAYADEGIELRKAGINLPIMIMSPDEQSFDSMVKYDLEPELFSFDILEKFITHITQSGIPIYPVHLKLDTGMHRLGFESEDITLLGNIIAKTGCLKIQSVFSHLAASDDLVQNNFTNQQLIKFTNSCDQLHAITHYEFIRHIANSSAISRNQSLHLDMVRLGIGLYGVDGNHDMQLRLRNVTSLKTTVAQVRKVMAGETVGYGRNAILERNSIIATVRIGYADGYPRILGNGIGKMLIHGKFAAVAGNVCMDMTMLDVTDIKNVQAGDEVIVFGEGLPVTDVAKWAHTISYEIMTGISQRVKRVYYES